METNLHKFFRLAKSLGIDNENMHVASNYLTISYNSLSCIPLEYIQGLLDGSRSAEIYGSVNKYVKTVIDWEAIFTKHPDALVISHSGVKKFIIIK